MYEEKDIQEEFISYFQNLLNSTDQLDSNEYKKILEVIPNLITQEKKEELERKVTQDEVKSALYAMSDDKSPSSDGFLVGFFKHN